MSGALRRIEDAASHDAAVAAHPYGTLQQTSRWGAYQDSYTDRTWEGVFEYVEDGRRIITFSVVSQALPGGYRYLLVPRGFLVEEGVTAAQIAAAVRALAAHFPKAVFVRFDPALERGTPAAALYEETMRALGATLAAVETTPTTTLLLDLALSEDALLAQMHPKGRYNIRIAGKHSVICRTGTTADVGAFAALMQETAGRTGISVHPERVYASMLGALGDAAAVEIAEYQGQIAAGMLTTRSHGTTTYYYGASSQAHKQVMAPYLLQWHAVRKARAAGDRWYDFLGIAPEDAAPGHPLAGVTEFKRKFGGIVRHEVAPMEVILRPVLHRAFLAAKALRARMRRH